MLQIELRVNGQLVDYVNVRNVTQFHEVLVGGCPGDMAYYQIEHGCDIEYVFHDRDDGVVVLVAKAMAKLHDLDTQ